MWIIPHARTLLVKNVRNTQQFPHMHTGIKCDTHTHTRARSTPAAAVRRAAPGGGGFSVLTLCTPTAQPASPRWLLSLSTTGAPRTHLVRHTHTHPGCERGSSSYVSADYPRIQ